MPHYLFLGVSEERFWNGTPNDLKPFDEAYNIRKKVEDSNNWMSGYYIMNGVMVALDKALSGRKSKAKYFDKPLLSQEVQKADEDLTEDEIVAQRKALLARLQIMQANFEMNHNQNSDE